MPIKHTKSERGRDKGQNNRTILAICGLKKVLKAETNPTEKREHLLAVFQIFRIFDLLCCVQKALFVGSTPSDFNYNLFQKILKLRIILS